jgi:hypothetical protein
VFLTINAKGVILYDVNSKVGENVQNNDLLKLLSKQVKVKSISIDLDQNIAIMCCKFVIIKIYSKTT